MLAENRDERQHRLQPLLTACGRILTIHKFSQGSRQTFGAQEELEQSCRLQWTGNAATGRMNVQSVQTLDVVVTKAEIWPFTFGIQLTFSKKTLTVTQMNNHSGRESRTTTPSHSMPERKPPCWACNSIEPLPGHRSSSRIYR